MTMTVREYREWLGTLEDQDAIVEVVVHRSDGGYYCQGGTASIEEFDPAEHVDYIDLRGNPYVCEGDPRFNRRSVVFGDLYA